MDSWLETTKDIQTKTFGQDPSALKGIKLRQFLHWNFTACIVELAEAIEEARWKPWAQTQEDEEIIPDRHAILTELIDAQMFIANILVSAGVSDDEYDAAYRAKWVKNIERQERDGGYESRKGIDKCINCRRSFDDIGRAVTDAYPQHCAKCEAEGTPGV